MVKVAFPSEDGKTISAHFGRAPLYVVGTIGDDGEIQYEQRQKEHHGAHEPHAHRELHSHGGHNHGSMFAPISDCQVLIAGGMGHPAYEHAREAGLEVILTGIKDIREAAGEYQKGSLTSEMKRIHLHH